MPKARDGGPAWSAKGPDPAKHVRVNLVRLLSSTEKLSNALATSDKHTKRRYETYVKVLSKYWQELSDGRETPADALTEYRRRIDRLAELVERDAERGEERLVRVPPAEESSSTALVVVLLGDALGLLYALDLTGAATELQHVAELVLHLM